MGLDVSEINFTTEETSTALPSDKAFLNISDKFLDKARTSVDSTRLSGNSSTTPTKYGVSETISDNLILTWPLTKAWTPSSTVII